MGWGLQPLALIEQHLRDGSLVELVPDTALEVPLYWQHARVASSLLKGLGRAVLAAARHALQPL
jgi:LysR family transcriptional regulator (chromosome initiation inhibitor)